MKGLMYNRQTDGLLSDVLRAKKKCEKRRLEVQMIVPIFG